MNLAIIKEGLKRNLPKILLTASIGGVVGGTAFSICGTVKTVKKLNELKETETMTSHIDTVDKVKAVWKYYIPAAILLGGTIFCICELNAVHVREEAALAAIGAMWKTKYNNLKEAVNETNKSAEEIKSKAIQKELSGAAPDGTEEVQPVAGTLLCWEPYSRQFFHATEQQLLWAELTANKEHASRGFLSLNDLLMLFPGCKKVNFGDSFGWFPGSDQNRWIYQTGTVFIEFDTSLQHIDGKECAVLQYSVKPDQYLKNKYNIRR